MAAEVGAVADAVIGVRHVDGGFEARMTLVAHDAARTTPEDATAVRTIVVPTCDEVWSAFALTLALALADLPRAPSEGEADRPATPMARGNTYVPTFGVGNSVRLMWGPIEAGMPAIAAFAEVEIPSKLRFFWPMLRLGFFTTDDVDFHTENQVIGTARLQVWGGEFEVCPFQLPWIVSVRVCARAELGEFRLTRNVHIGSVPFPTYVDSEDFLWSTAGATLSVRWMPVRPVFLQADGAVGVVLSKQHFSSVDNYISGSARELGISAGVHFP